MAPRNQDGGTVEPVYARPARKHRTLGEAAGSLGSSLSEIAGKEVIVSGIEFDTRPVKSKKPEDNGAMVPMDCAILIVDDGTEFGARYFVFGAVVDKLRGVDITELPLPATFTKKDIGGGQSTWDIK